MNVGVKFDASDDLLSDEAINQPEVYFRKLRELGPVHWNKRWNGWIVTSYDAVSAGFKDAERLSSDRFSGPFGAELKGDTSDHEKLMGFLSKFFVWKDPPYHTRARALVSRVFSPRQLDPWRARLKLMVRELAEPLRSHEPVNFLGGFAFTLPVMVISEILGIDDEHRENVRKWSEDMGAVIFVGGNQEEKYTLAENAMSNLAELFKPLVRARMASPTDDVLSALCKPDEKGERLTEEEVIANAVLMIFAGHETTMNLLSNGMVALSRHPEQWQLLRQQPELAMKATEEMLRYDGPIRGMGRWAKAPLELGGQQIKEGDRVFLIQHAANRDAAAFPNPDVFDMTRWPNRHVAFGMGIHTCLGAPLARMEVQEALLYLTQEFSGVEVVTPTLRYNRTMVSRGLKELEVRFLP